MTGTLLPSLANFYDTYSTKFKKPMMISETGAVHHLNADWSENTPGPDAITIKLPWWRQFLNVTFFQTFPKLKMVCLYEMVEPGADYEKGLWLDYQVANASKPDLLNEFLNELQNIDGEFKWASTNGNETTWVSPNGRRGPDHGNTDDGSRVTRVALATLVLLPVLVVGVLAGIAIRKRWKRNHGGGDLEGAGGGQGGHSRSASTDGSESGKGSVVEEEVDDSDTIINFDMGELGPPRTPGSRTVSMQSLPEGALDSRAVSRAGMENERGLEIDEIDADQARRGSREPSAWRDSDPETRTL